MVTTASASNSVFALVLGLLAFLYLGHGRGRVRRNQCRTDRPATPAGPLTPFTDNVELTPGDQQAYSGQAEAQRMKGFQAIDVTYDNAGPDEI